MGLFEAHSPGRKEMNGLSRREFIVGTAALAVTFPGRLPAQDDAYGGFKMGVQTYSLRHFDLDATLKHIRDFGLKYAQFYGGKQMHVTSDAAKIGEWKKKLQEAGIEILSFGVEGFGKNHEANKKKFEFARAMGFPVFTASPSADSFDSLKELTKEYGVKIAIHNHGPEDRAYGKLDQVLKALDGRPEEIGACVDTGHVIRVGEDPVAWIKKLGSRVYDVHLKDASAPNKYEILGRGKLDILATLQALKEIKFGGLLALEYELNPKDPIADMKACLEAVREAAKKL